MIYETEDYIIVPFEHQETFVIGKKTAIFLERGMTVEDFINGKGTQNDTIYLPMEEMDTIDLHTPTSLP